MVWWGRIFSFFNKLTSRGILKIVEGSQSIYVLSDGVKVSPI